MSNAEVNDQYHSEEIAALKDQHSRELRAQAAASHLAGAQQTERAFRESLWLGHGCHISALYGDDGEMQCNAQTCRLDFKRTPVDALINHLGSRLAKQSEELFNLELANKSFKELLKPDHGADWGNKRTFDDIIATLLIARTPGDFCKEVDKGLLIGAWGMLFTEEEKCIHRYYTPAFARNVRSLLLGLMNAAYDRAAELAQNIYHGLADETVVAAKGSGKSDIALQIHEAKAYAASAAETIREEILKLKVTK